MYLYSHLVFVTSVEVYLFTYFILLCFLESGSRKWRERSVSGAYSAAIGRLQNLWRERHSYPLTSPCNFSKYCGIILIYGSHHCVRIFKIVLVPVSNDDSTVVYLLYWWVYLLYWLVKSNWSVWSVIMSDLFP